MVAERLRQQMREERIEQPDLDAVRPHLLPEAAPRRDRTVRVGEHADPDAAADRAGERVAETPARGVVLEDVGLDEDFLARLVDRRAHGLERLGPAKVRLHPVALEDRRLVDPPQQDRESLISQPVQERCREPAPPPAGRPPSTAGACETSWPPRSAGRSHEEQSRGERIPPPKGRLLTDCGYHCRPPERSDSC